MTVDRVLYLVGDVLLIVAVLALAWFMVAYHLNARWQESPGGRHIMAFSAVLELVLILGAGAVTFGSEYALRPYFRVLVYGLLVWVVARRYRLMLSTQKAAREARRQAVKEMVDDDRADA